jgi:hypothetical protein
VDTSQPVAVSVSPSATNSPAGDSASDAAGKAAVAAYDAALKFQVGAFAKMNATAGDYQKYLTSPALDSTQYVTGFYQSQGIVYAGKPRWRATVTAVDLVARPPTVTLSVCFSNNGWRPVYKATGEPYITSNTDPPHELETVGLVRLRGAWLLSDVEVQAKPC